MFIASMKPRIDVYHISPLCKSRKILYVSPVHQYQAQTWNVFKRYFRVCKSKTTFTWMYFKKKKKRKKKKRCHQSGMFLGKGVVDYLIYSEITSYFRKKVVQWCPLASLLQLWNNRCQGQGRPPWLTKASYSTAVTYGVSWWTDICSFLSKVTATRSVVTFFGLVRCAANWAAQCADKAQGCQEPKSWMAKNTRQSTVVPVVKLSLHLLCQMDGGIIHNQCHWLL